MKTLMKLALVTVIAMSAFAASAQVVNGYLRSNGTYVMPYVRTPANGIPYDNLSYRGYPSQQPGYVSPRTYSMPAIRPMPLPPVYNFKVQTMPNPYRSYAPRALKF
jgi:hypothetical protein